jgi:hypothetical protein
VAVARHFGGFAAVDRMTWQEYALARQMLVEERIGTRIREAQRVEDAKFRKSKKALEKRR